MLTFFSNTIIQPLCSRGRRQKNSTSLIHRSSGSRLSSLSSVNLIFFIAVLLLATVAQATVAATGSDQFEIMMRRRMMAAPSAAARSSAAALSQSYSTALLFGNKRGGSLLSSLSISRRGSVGNNHVGRRLASAATASWRDQHSSAAAAFITSLSVPSSTELIRQKHYDKNHFQYNCNNKNYFFSTTAAINQVPPSTRVTAIHATVPKSDEKHVKKSSSKPNSTTPKSINRKQTKKNVSYDYTTIHNNPLPPNYTIKSKPKPNNSGNWNPSAPLEWCQNFGSRSPSMTQHLSTIIQLSPDDEGYIPPEVYNNEEYPNVTIVRTKEQAQIVLEALQQSKLTEPERIHACDTEVMDIDLSNVGPVGNGYVTCLSVYSGPDFDYGLNNDQGGASKGTMLWIDNLDDATGILDEFKDWLEDETVMKVWHNYGFDRHVLWNEGIDVKGFGGDTSK